MEMFLYMAGGAVATLIVWRLFAERPLDGPAADDRITIRAQAEVLKDLNRQLAAARSEADRLRETNERDRAAFEHRMGVLRGRLQTLGLNPDVLESEEVHWVNKALGCVTVGTTEPPADLADRERAFVGTVVRSLVPGSDASFDRPH